MRDVWALALLITIVLLGAALPNSGSLFRRFLVATIAVVVALAANSWFRNKTGNNINDFVGDLILCQIYHKQSCPDLSKILIEPEDQADREAWRQATEAGTLEAYQQYLKRFPKGVHGAKAQQEVVRRKLEAFGPYPRVYETTLRTFRSYVCMAMINYFAGRLGFSAEMVTDATQASQPKSIAFMRPDRTPVCGQVVYKPSEPSSKNNHRENNNLYEISQIHAKAFEAIKDRIRDEAFRVANEFLPPNNIVAPEPSISVIENIAEDYQHDIEKRLSEARMEQSSAILLAKILNIPDATGPNIRVMNDHMTDAAHTYAAYLDWEKQRRDVVHGAFDPDAP